MKSAPGVKIHTFLQHYPHAKVCALPGTTCYLEGYAFGCIYYFANCLQSMLLSQFACLFLSVLVLQQNFKTTACVVIKFLGSIRTVTKKNQFKCGHDRLNILDSGALLSYVTTEIIYSMPVQTFCKVYTRLPFQCFFYPCS